MSNKRIFYATQSINLQPVSTGANPMDYRNPDHYKRYSNWIQPLGLQSAGISTTFNTEPVSQLGTLAIYSQVETSPEVEVTLSKLVDGSAPLYSLCTGGSGLKSVDQDITEIATNMVNIRFAVSKDSDSKATGTLSHHTLCSGMYLNSINFTFPVDGNATEEITLVGSRKIWGGAVTVPSGASMPLGQTASMVARRQHISISGANVDIKGTRVRDTNTKKLTDYPSATLLPDAILNQYKRTVNGVADTPKVQNITVSANLNRENINELGFFGPYYKYTTFPIEVTSEFELVSVSGDLIRANDFEIYDNDDNPIAGSTCDINYSNTPNEEIIIKVCGATSNDALYIDLGDRNRLTSVNYTGGDTGGGNATVTYSYQTFNKFNVIPVGSYANFASHNGSTWSSGTLT